MMFSDSTYQPACFGCGAPHVTPGAAFCSPQCELNVAALVAAQQQQQQQLYFAAAAAAANAAAAAAASSAPGAAPTTAMMMMPAMPAVTAGAAAASPMTGGGDGTCRCCGRAALMRDGSCSRRCAWVLQRACPQCGRGRAAGNAEQAYCSVGCASQANQANWCLHCGVRQVAAGGFNHCSPACAAHGAGDFAVRPRRKVAQANSQLAHELVPFERSRGGVANAAASQLAEQGLTLLGVVKVTPHALRRRQFLTYRAAVEHQMAASAAAKYGAGGEANEQRRFFAVAARCSLGTDVPGATLAAGGCGDAACEACAVLGHGMSLGAMRRQSHYGSTDLHAAAQVAVAAAAAAPGALKAIVVARAVIGVPQMLAPTDAITGAPPEGTHCSIISDGEPSRDGVYFFRDDAVHPEYVIVFY